MGALLVAGCAHRSDGPVNLIVGHEGERCTVTLVGRPLVFDPDGSDFRRWRGRLVTMVGTGDTPYRCVGGLIFALQRAGVERIGFISRPAPHQAE